MNESFCLRDPPWAMFYTSYNTGSSQFRILTMYYDGYSESVEGAATMLDEAEGKRNTKTPRLI